MIMLAQALDRGIFAVAGAFALFASLSFASVPTPTVLVQPAKLSELYDTLSYPARVIPKVNATVLSEVDGEVARIAAPLGERVRRGQRLLVIQHTDPAFQFAPFSVTAPVSGVVSLVEVNEGSRVTKGQKLISVTDPSKLRVLVEVASVDLPMVSPKLSGELKVNGRSESIPVKIRGVSPFVDPATGTATCELDIDAPDVSKFNLPPGVVGQVSFKVNEHKGYSITDQAIVYRGKNPLLRIIENGKSKSLSVALGRRQRGFVEILSGLSEGMQVIERASGFLADGDAVTIETQ